MKKAHWFTLALALVLLVPFLPVPGGDLAQPASAGRNPAAVHAPILGPFIDIWVDAVSNFTPAVAFNSLHDEYLVVWSNLQGPNTQDIYARRVGSDGTLKSWFAVATGAGEERWQPVVAYSPAQDEYLIVYTFKFSANDHDIRAKRINWNGAWMSAEFTVNADADLQYWPAVAYNSQDDEYLVVYQNQWSGGLRDIAAQRVRASDGVLLSWRNIATGSGPFSWRDLPDVAYNATRNEYLIAYETVFLDWDIYGKVASADLGTLSNEIHICEDTSHQKYVAVAAGPDEYLVVWQDGASGSTDHDIAGRRVSGASTPQGPSGGFPIAASTTNYHAEPDVAYGRGYGYLVTWRYDDPGPSGRDIYARYVMRGQDAGAGNQFAIDNGSDSQLDPAVACALSGGCLVAEEDSWPGPDYEIRGRFVTPYRVYLPIVLKNH